MINILYEDNHLLVVEKPINIPVCEDESKDEDLLNILKVVNGIIKKSCDIYMKQLIFKKISKNREVNLYFARIVFITLVVSYVDLIKCLPACRLRVTLASPLLSVTAL